MLRLIVRRLLMSAVLILVISLLAFVLQSLAPGDMARTILESGSDGFGGYTEEQYQDLRRELRLDQPLLVQYGHWFSGAIQGDFGTSPISGLNVTSMIVSRLSVTLSIVLLGTLATAALGVALGVVSAVRGGRVGACIDVLSVIGYAVPSFWLGLLLMQVFAVTLGIFPATGYESLGASPGDWARSLVLPVATLTLSSMAGFAKQSRDSMLNELSRDYVRMLRANGASERSIVLRHALRNAAIPLVTLTGLMFIALFGGAVFIENVFALPGIGRLVVQAAHQNDLPMLQGIVVMLTLIVVLINLVVDLLYGWLNPKVRAS